MKMRCSIYYNGGQNQSVRINVEMCESKKVNKKLVSKLEVLRARLKYKCQV